MSIAIQLNQGKLSSITVSRPELSNPNDVVIEVSHAGVCGTDLSIIDGDFPAAKSVIMGHEISGVVCEIGENVEYLKIGDR